MQTTERYISTTLARLKPSTVVLERGKDRDPRPLGSNNAGLFDESAVISQTPSPGACNYSGSARVNDPSCVTPQCVGTVCTLQLVWRLISVLRARAPRSSTSGPGVGCRQLTVAMQNIHARACRVYARHGCQLRGTRYTAYPELPKEIQLLVQEATNLGEETVDHEPERISQRAIAASQTGRSSCGTQRAGLN